MTHTAPITAADLSHLVTFRAWLATQPQTAARELEMALDTGLDGDRLELNREHWVVFGNYLEWSANELKLPKARYVAAAELGRLVTAALRAMPRPIAPPTPDPVEPLGEPVGQMALF